VRQVYFDPALAPATKTATTMLKAYAPRPTSLVALATFLLVLAQGAAGQGIVQATGKSFFENFSTFDQRRWIVTHGRASGDFQDCLFLASHVRPVDKGLELRLTDAANSRSSFTCAEMQTAERYGYGIYEVRMRAAGAVPGTVSAFFTFVRPPHDEIDIEFVGKSPKQIQVNHFVNAVSQRGKAIDLDFDTTASMNDYAFEWLPDALRWFANGRLIHEVKKSAGTPFPVTPGSIHLSVWNGKAPGTDAWLGRFVYPGHPLVARYEYIAFTEAGQPCQFPTSIVCARKGSPKAQ
jgi:endo-1,3-1,4-beta-glycanase ExoK